MVRKKPAECQLFVQTMFYALGLSFECPWASTS